MRTHLEGKHHMSSGYACDFCSVAVYKTKQEVNQHKRVCASRTQQSFWIKTWFWFLFCHSDLVWSYASRTEDGKLACSLCTTFVTHKKYNMRTHLEGVHDLTAGYQCDSCYVVKKTQQTLDKHKLVCRSKMAWDMTVADCYFCQMLLRLMPPEQKTTSSPAPSATISHTKSTTWGFILNHMSFRRKPTNVPIAMCWWTPGSYSGNINLYVRSTTRCKTCNMSNKLSFPA